MKEFMRVLIRFVPPYKKYLFVAVLLNLLTAVLNVFSFSLIIPILQMLFKINKKVYSFIPWGTGDLKNTIINNFYYCISEMIKVRGETMALLLLGLFLVTMTFFKTASYYLSSATMIPIRTGVVRDLRIKLYEKIVSLPLSFFSEQRKGDVLARMSGDVNEVENSIMASLDMLFKNPILIVIYVFTMIMISWQLTLFTILIVPGLGWLMGYIGRKLKQGSLKAQEKWSDLLSQLEETLGGLRVIKAFNAQKAMIARFTDCNNSYRKIINGVNTRQQMSGPMGEFLGTIMIVVVLWFGGSLILKNESSINAPSFIFYLLMLYSIINPLKDLSKAGYGIPKGMASMERIDKILMAENNIKEKVHPFIIEGLNQKIEFKNVSFGYDYSREVLGNINLTIEKGNTVALVGQSGSGKSTLVDLLPRFYDIEKGEILIDGVNIKEMSIPSLRSIMGNVNQEAILFNDTFYNNIVFGQKNVTEADVIEAAKVANAHDFIMASENEYETNIGDRGCKLSGGQRQRISIARAVLRNPPVLILDEATSALDTESEHLVQEALDNLMKNRTTIVIAHRLSTIKNADEICVMNDGEIVERGKHDDLIRRNGYYKRLVDMQKF